MNLYNKKPSTLDLQKELSFNIYRISILSEMVSGVSFDIIIYASL